MPFFDDNLEDENNQNPGQAQISGASSTSDSQGNISSSGNKGAPATGSGYQNLDKYLSTNSPQQFGQQFLDKTSQTVSGAQKGIDTAGQAFKSEINSGNSIPTSDQVNSAIANPTGADPKAFQGWETNTYTGPKSLSENSDLYNDFYSGINKANTETKLLGTEPGRFTLLDSYFGKPSYNYGQKSLDNLLVQQSGLGGQTRQLQNQAAQLKTQADQSANDLQNQASVRAGQVEQSKNDVLNAIGLDANGKVVTGDNAGAIGKQYQQVNDAVTAANAARASQVSGLKKELQGRVLSPDELAKYGFTPGEQTYGVDISQFENPNADLTKDQVITPDQRAYIQALSQLAGLQDEFANGTPQAATDAFSYDSTRAQSAINDAKVSYQNEAKDQFLNNLKSIYPNSDLSGYQQLTPDQITADIKHAQDVRNAGVNVSQYGKQLAAIGDALDSKYKLNDVINSTATPPPAKLRIGR